MKSVLNSEIIFTYRNSFLSAFNMNFLPFPVLVDDHKENEAIEELKKGLDFKPHLQLLHLRAAFHDSMGDHISAVRNCEAALCLDPNHTDTLELYNKARERVKE
ncbi:hypothetical protein PTKIN_Ptkin13bG0301500 [Pterospermum kingtungense]